MDGLLHRKSGSKIWMIWGVPHVFGHLQIGRTWSWDESLQLELDEDRFFAETASICIGMDVRDGRSRFVPGQRTVM